MTKASDEVGCSSQWVGGPDGIIMCMAVHELSVGACLSQCVCERQRDRHRDRQAGRQTEERREKVEKHLPILQRKTWSA